MEMILISLCLTTFFAFFFLKSLLKRTTATNLNLPPSPWRLPIIGNLHQLSLHPHRSFHSLSIRYGPLMLLHFGRVPVLVVSSADVAQDVMKTHDRRFANRPKTKAVDIIMNGGRDVAFSSYGEYWRQMKSLCTVHLLGKKMVKSFEKVREEEITAMMVKLEQASSSSVPVNLSEFLLNLFNNVVCRTAMGRKYSREENTSDFGRQLRIIMELLGSFPVGDYIPDLAWIDKIRGLDRKMVEVSKTFVDFLERVVQEEEIVFINAWAIHRDTATWGRDAEEFKPERHFDLPLEFSGQDFNFIPFESGRRLCPGIGFALALIEVALANLVNRFNWRVESRQLGDDDQYYLAEATGID